MKNVKSININVKLKDLFRRWLDITQSFHNLTNQQKDVLALLLYYHNQLQYQITTPKILWRMVFDYDTKMKIKEELGMKDSGLQNVLTSLRKDNVIKSNVILNGYIPTIEKDAESFKIVFNLNIVSNGEGA